MPSWQANAVSIIRACDPHGADRPCYIVDARRCRRYYRLAADLAGFTSGVLSGTLKPLLIHQGRWEGAGFAAVIDPTALPTDEDRIAGCLHEYGHDVCLRAMLTAAGAPQLAPPEASEPPAVAALVRGPSSDRPPWGLHDARFNRICAHLVFRAWRFSTVDLQQVARQYPPLSDPLAYASALGDEPRARAGEPLLAIAASPPPPAFAQFAKWDLDHATRLWNRQRKQRGAA